MGMYDSVLFRCPYCGEMTEVQSKAGQCDLSCYSDASVPAGIADDLIGTTAACDTCGKEFGITDVPRRVSFVELVAVRND